jgi:hypothetical protein
MVDAVPRDIARPGSPAEHFRLGSKEGAIDVVVMGESGERYRWEPIAVAQQVERIP